MEGTIVFINQHTGFFAVQITENDYTVIELLDTYEIEIGDVITGALHSLGGEKIKNITKNESISVFIQKIYCTLSSARALVFR